jgi:prepilin-type N-terminal cleavage/methylation domain-containing protein
MELSRGFAGRPPNAPPPKNNAFSYIFKNLGLLTATPSHSYHREEFPLLLMKRRRLAAQEVAETGMTLVELLVVLAIIAALAGIIYPAIIDSIKKSEVSMAAQRVDAVEKAKVQYQLDNVDSQTIDKTAGTADMPITALQPYLVRLGQNIASSADLSNGTGGTIHPGNLASHAYFTPSNQSDQSMLSLLQKYGVPTSSGPEPTGSVPGPSPGQ